MNPSCVPLVKRFELDMVVMGQGKVRDTSDYLKVRENILQNSGTNLGIVFVKWI